MDIVRFEHDMNTTFCGGRDLSYVLHAKTTLSYTLVKVLKMSVRQFEKKPKMRLFSDILSYVHKKCLTLILTHSIL